MEHKQNAPMYPDLPPQQNYPQPPPPSYTPHPQVQQPQVHMTTLNVIPVGPRPTDLTCPSCHATVQTRVVHEANNRTHIIAALLCLFGLWCCVCVPYCMDSCQNANHYCPSCNAFLGSYRS